MKRIINGRRYDTQAPQTQLVAEHDSGHYGDDFHAHSESLYRTGHGNWFLHGRGGAYTSWATVCGDNRGWGERIVPMTQADAREWLEHADTQESIDALETYFADEVQDA